MFKKCYKFVKIQSYQISPNICESPILSILQAPFKKIDANVLKKLNFPKILVKSYKCVKCVGFKYFKLQISVNQYL
jgi:hypothetical protein